MTHKPIIRNILLLLVVVLLSGMEAPRSWASNYRYTVTDLGTLGGNTSYAYGINNLGQVVGKSNVGGLGHVFLYTPGSGMTDLGNIGGGTCNATASGINDNGQIVGSFTNDSNQTRGFEYSPGIGVTYIGTLGGLSSSASSINDNGEITGWADTSSGYAHAFVYDSNSGIKDIGTLGASSSWGFAINSSGQVAGVSNLSNGNRHAFLYSPGSGMTDLGSLANGMPSAGFGINDSGQVVGWAERNYSAHLVIDSPGGQMMDIDQLDGKDSGNAINNNGDIVGTYHITSDHAFIYSDGKMKDLNTLIDPSSGWTLTSANDINTLGQIVGTGTNSYGQTHAYLLMPTPEPSSLALLGMSGVLIFWRRRRVAG